MRVFALPLMTNQNLNTFAESLIARDKSFLWHPYDNCFSDKPLFPIQSANKCLLKMADGRDLVDAMSSWWSAIHGYNHPILNEAAEKQLRKMSHVMFGGLTHEPAVELAETLVGIAPGDLNKVFFSDSGSVSVEVAMKMAVQYWIGRKQADKYKFLSFKHAYHGDTFAAMSVCDPVNGMHHMFRQVLPEHYFAPAPTPGFGESWNETHCREITEILHHHHQEIAAVIIEPIVQGTGGMRVYSADFLKQLRQLCDTYNVLLIADEIATGFGRTGRLFACEHAAIAPDILCLGKAMTGGYLSLAATLCSEKIARDICATDAGVFMHGPTFMANPLACAISQASIGLLLSSPWQNRIASIENHFKTHLLPLKELNAVSDTRSIGAIGAIEMAQNIDVKTVTEMFVKRGVWIRPFGKLLYSMPPYIIEAHELQRITDTMREVAEFYS